MKVGPLLRLSLTTRDKLVGNPPDTGPVLTIRHPAASAATASSPSLSALTVAVVSAFWIAKAERFGRRRKPTFGTLKCWIPLGTDARELFIAMPEVSCWSGTPTVTSLLGTSKAITYRILRSRAGAKSRNRVTFWFQSRNVGTAAASYT